MDKERVKQTMLELEQQQFEASRDAYLDYVRSARLDRSEPIENDELAQAAFARDLSEAFDEPVHAHAEKIAKLQRIDFGPRSAVEEGAIIKVAGRHFVVAVATDRFICDGNELMGISTAAPLYAAIEGKQAGDTCTFNGREIRIDAVI
jgi:CRISPR/Cas system-associated exonuclease Cas4 (RecB family)